MFALRRLGWSKRAAIGLSITFGLVALPALPAMAHGSVVSGGQTTCQADGTYSITWTVANDYNLLEQVWLVGQSVGGSASSYPTVGIATNTSLPGTPIAASPGTPYKSITFTESGIPGSTTSAGVSVKGTWSDHYTNTNSAGSVSFDGKCKPAAAKPLTLSVTANATYQLTYAWTIGKQVDTTLFQRAAGTSAVANYTVSVSHDAGTSSGWTLGGTVTISNPNAFAVTVNSLSVTNPFLGGSCSVGGGPTWIIPASGSLNPTYSCTYLSAPSPSSGTLTATAGWATPQGSHTWTTTSASNTAAASWSSPTVKDGSVTVTDPMGGGTLGTATSSQTNPIAFTYSKDFSADPSGTCTSHENTATYTTSDSETTGTASVSVNDCIGADLQVSKTVVPSFTRTYNWTINKSVDHSQLFAPAGSSVTANYKVIVTHDDGTDSGWALTGKITVTNPNDWEAITANVADNFPGSCVVTGGTSVLVPAGKSVSLDYNCGFTLASDTPSLNSATATWDAAASFTPTGSATGTAPFVLSGPTSIIDGSVSLSDSLRGVLGTVSYTDPKTNTFTYPLKFEVPTGPCQTHDNTASLQRSTTEGTLDSSASVGVCGTATLTVLKQDELTTKALAGATFQLRLGTVISGPSVTSAGTAVGTPCTTDASGTCSVADLEPGTYYWQETAAPAGYVLPSPTDPADFTVATQQPTIANVGDTLTTTVVGDIKLPFTGCETDPTACLLKVKKIDSVTGQVLAGAEFSVYLGSSKTPLGTCTTANNGVCAIHYTAPGTYTWYEIKAPKGYALPKDPKVGTVVVSADTFLPNVEVLVVEDVTIPTTGPLPHTGLELPIGQVLGWSLTSILLGMFLVLRARRRREN